ncbi:MAG: hypothetical protein ABIT64_03640 [Lysobacteraceae bacterium]
MRRLMLALSIVCFTATPIAFAHSQHATAKSSSQSASHSGVDRHGYASANNRGATRDNKLSLTSDIQDQSTNVAANQRSRARVPDEEEVEQPEE